MLVTSFYLHVEKCLPMNLHNSASFQGNHKGGFEKLMFQFLNIEKTCMFPSYLESTGWRLAKVMQKKNQGYKKVQVFALLA